MTHIFNRAPENDRFGFYEELFGDLEGKTVMDFGGNSGNLLHFSDGKIREEDYTCVDVDLEVMEQSMMEYPMAEWLHYNTHHPVYNPTGIRFAPLPQSRRETFDYIFSYSVFSHTDFKELHYTLNRMRAVYSPTVMAHSIQLTSDHKMAEWYYDRRVEEYGRCADFQEAFDDCKESVTLVDNDTVYVDTMQLPLNTCKHLVTFYKKDWLLSMLKFYGFDVQLVKPTGCYQTYILIKSA
jgi:hypothetical protein